MSLRPPCPPLAPAVTDATPPSTADRPRLVLDTQVLLDWLVFDDPRVAPLAAALQAGRLQWLASPWMRLECERTLGRRMLQRWQPDALRVAAAWDRWATMVDEPLPRRLPRCRDPDDQAFIDLALQHRVTALLSRDRALLALRRAGATAGVWIGPPEAWLARAAATDPGAQA